MQIAEMYPVNDDGPVLHVDADTGEILDDDGQRTGRTIEDLAEEYVPPFYIKTDRPQLSLDLEVPEGVRVVGSTLRCRIPEMPLLGQYKIGERVRLEIEVEIDEVHHKAVRSRATSEIVGIDRVHKGTVCRGQNG